MNINGLQETSTSFDIDVFKRFLEDVLSHISSGMGLADINRIMEESGNLEVDDSKEYEYKPIYQNEETRFIINVYKDDFDTVDVFFFSPPPFKELLENIMRNLSG